MDESILQAMNQVRSYKLIAPGYRARLKKTIENINAKEGELILDIGCGGGEIAQILTNLGAKIIGVDVEGEALLTARKRVPDGMFILADVQRLPVKKEVFKKVCSVNVMEHVDDDTAAMREAYRVLKKNGIFALDLPCSELLFFRDPINFILKRAVKKQLKFLGGWKWGHRREYKFEEIKELVEKSDFDVLKAELTMYELIGLAHNYLPEIFTFIIMPFIKRFKLIFLRGDSINDERHKEPGIAFKILYATSEFICKLDNKTRIGKGGGSYSLLLQK